MLETTVAGKYQFDETTFGNACGRGAERQSITRRQVTGAASKLSPVHIGCSGWNYQSWRQQLYPAELPSSRWLERYSELFGTVEVNTTFYRLVSRDAVSRWLAQTPKRFIFAVKASRFLTHIKRLTEMESGVQRFYQRIEPLIEAKRLGPVLWQLPESFHADTGRLAYALEQLPSGRHAFEFRHASWFTKETYRLLCEHDAALVLGDHPERPFQTDTETARWRYVRLHYGAHGRRGNYSERELASWAERLHEWRRRGELFVYFNNDWEAFAPRNAAWLAARLAKLAGEQTAHTALSAVG